jgi:hypothetical protein
VSAADQRRPAGAPGPGAPDVSGPTEPDAIRADIEATREQLGRTVDELTHRLDVPTRARERALRTRDTAVETYRESPPAVLGAAAILLGVVVAVIVWRRKR